MKSSLFKLIWCGFPLTKLVYAYLAYTRQNEIDNTFGLINILFLLIGFVTCFISILLSKKIYQKTFYENKIVTLLFANRMTEKESSDTAVIFNLFSVLLGLAESVALFGFVQYLVTGNLIVGIILFALCFVAWLFNYPVNEEEED